MNDALRERTLIRELLERWVITRDSADWDGFARVWHPHGVMMATWFQGPAADFIRVSREGFEAGVRILHTLSGTTVELSAERAVAQTKMTITQRALVHDVLCDVVCTGRFFDLLTRDTGEWTVRLRQPIYEQDRLDPVAPGATLALDPALLGGFPTGYRHLAYVQTLVGYAVKPDMPGLVGPEVEALAAAGRAWLAGGPPAWPPASA